MTGFKRNTINSCNLILVIKLLYPTSLLKHYIYCANIIVQNNNFQQTCYSIKNLLIWLYFQWVLTDLFTQVNEHFMQKLRK